MTGAYCCCQPKRGELTRAKKLHIRAPKIRGPQNGAEKSQLLGFFHLQSTPRKAEIVHWGYNWRTWSGRRDICATGLLATILVVLALTVGGFMDSIRIIHIRADVCTNGDSTLAENMAIMRNITRYHESRAVASATVDLTATAYYEAETVYNALETRYKWPSPYNLSEEERQELEVQARQGGDNCEAARECVGGIVGLVGGIFGGKTCAEVEVPCPDIEATALLVQYDTSQKSLDLFGRNTTSEAEYNTTLAESAMDAATDAITVLVRRVNFASSIYVLYLAFLVIVTPPFVVYGAKWNRRIFDFLANVNKPIWIVLVVVVWYAHEAFNAIINSSLYKVIWANFLHDPCWADPEFLVNTSTVITETCTGVTSAHNLYSQASANYRYYDQVENTWQAGVKSIASFGPFYGDPDVDLISEFPGNCTPTVLLDAIQPSDGRVNWWSLFIKSGALVALLLQIALAHWFISWFNVLRPLTMCRGRVMIPESSHDDAVLYHEVMRFARARAILPFVFSTVLVILLLVNLGVSSSEEGMDEKALYWGLWLFGLQFIMIPLLIWRPSDESMLMNLTTKDLENQQQQRRQQEQQYRDDGDEDGDREVSSEFDSEGTHYAVYNPAQAGGAGYGLSDGMQRRNSSDSDLDGPTDIENGADSSYSAGGRSTSGDHYDNGVVFNGTTGSLRGGDGSVIAGSSRGTPSRRGGALRRLSSSLSISSKTQMPPEERAASDHSLSEAVRAALAATSASRAVSEISVS